MTDDPASYRFGILYYALPLALVAGGIASAVYVPRPSAVYSGQEIDMASGETWHVVGPDEASSDSWLVEADPSPTDDRTTPLAFSVPESDLEFAVREGRLPGARD